VIAPTFVLSFCPARNFEATDGRILIEFAFNSRLSRFINVQQGPRSSFKDYRVSPDTSSRSSKSLHVQNCHVHRDDGNNKYKNIAGLDKPA